LLDEHPWIADAELLTACVLGRAERIGQLLRSDRSLAATLAGPRGWTPLLYLCFSRFLRPARKHSGGFVEAARLLLDAGPIPTASSRHEQEHTSNARRRCMAPVVWPIMRI